MDAAKVSSAVYGAADAVAWAAEQGWTGIPQSAIDNNYRPFVAHGRNAQQMSRRRLQQLRPRRLNATRVDACISADNPMRALLLRLGEEGIEIPVPEDMVYNGAGPWPPLRNGYVTAHQAVNKTCFALWEQGLAMVIRPQVAMEFVKLISPSGHALKKG